MVGLAQEINSRMPRYVIQRCATLLNEHGKSVRGARVLLFPGLVLQRATTREPSMDETRVALAAVASVLRRELD